MGGRRRGNTSRAFRDPSDHVLKGVIALEKVIVYERSLVADLSSTFR